MAAVFVIVAKVSAHELDKMTSVKDDHMIEQLPSATADPSFRDTIGLGCRMHPMRRLSVDLFGSPTHSTHC